MADQNINNMSVTWNSGGTTFVFMKANITDTASAAASLLVQLQVGGVDKFTISKTGLVATLGGLKLKQSAAPVPTGEGELEWNSTTNNFAVGDGANTLTPGKPPTAQVFTANGTWTKPAGCRFIVVEAVGAGGGSGGCTGALGNCSASGGGGSGFYGKTVPIDVSAVASGAVAIGAAGTAGAAGNNAGGTGGSTTITIGATTYTWPGGDGSPGNTANPSNNYRASQGHWAALGTNVKGSSNQGEKGSSNNADTVAFGGHGASSPFGVGGDQTTGTVAGGSAGNVAGVNTGAGGGGGYTVNNAINRAGAAGGSGYMRVWEYY